MSGTPGYTSRSVCVCVITEHTYMLDWLFSFTIYSNFFFSFWKNYFDKCIMELTKTFNVKDTMCKKLFFCNSTAFFDQSLLCDCDDLSDHRRAPMRCCFVTSSQGCCFNMILSKKLLSERSGSAAEGWIQGWKQFGRFQSVVTNIWASIAQHRFFLLFF